jgi:hypothetical protein
MGFVTYAAYHRLPDGTWFRLGTFRGPRGSVRNVTAAFVKRHPLIDVATVEFARRIRMMGSTVDGPRVKAEL